MGVHHAREWPSSEHTIEFAYDLLRNYGRDARTTQLVQSTRTIVVPVVNPDGFNISREAAALGDFSLFDYEMKRKNCRVSANTPTQVRERHVRRQQGRPPARHRPEPQLRRPVGRQRREHDLVRRHLPRRRAVLGARGAEHPRADLVAAGHEPDHEPHFSNLVLRPPGVASFGFPLEEPIYKALGASLAAHNGYSNIPGFGLYDTTGATEDWSFWSTGGLAFTFEIGGIDFHPAFHDGVEAEYLGARPRPARARAATARRTTRCSQATADSSLHSRIEGSAPAGSTLRISKTFQTSTSPVWQDDFGTAIGDPRLFTDTLTSELKAAGRRRSPGT